MSDDGVKITLGGFAEVTLSLPIDWLTDPHKSVLWRHHLLTLRWLRDYLTGEPRRCSELCVRVLLDFFAYHESPTTPKSPYFEDRVADHTMAERLLLFADVYTCSNLPEQLRMRIERMARAHFERLMSQDVYRPRTNHGLMVDKAILCASAAIPSADPDARYSRVALHRCAEQIDWLYTSEAATREHSVSYQEYNLNICLELRDALVKAGIAPELVSKLDALLRRAQELLTFATDFAGNYLPLGDSFRQHNPVIIAALRRQGLLENELAFVLTRGAEGAPPKPGMVVYPEAGFAFVRKGDPARPPVQLAMTAGWHSDVHKQADDLSFVLNDALGELIVDAGYSDRRAESEPGQRTRSEWAHNVVVCRERPWRSFTRGLDLKSSTRLTHCHASDDVAVLRGQHARIEGVMVRRTVVLVGDGRLLVLDAIESEAPVELSQLFHLAPGLVASKLDRHYRVHDAAGRLRARFSAVGPARVEVVNDTAADGPVCVRWRDRSDTEPTSCLVCSATAETGPTLLLAQLIEFGAALADAAGPRVAIQGLSVTNAEVAFDLVQGESARPVRIELLPLSAGRLRWP